MPQRKIGRREFLKLTIAAAGAAGLSHFRILNIGGADVALAQHDDCTNDPGPPPVSTDICAVGASPDTCPEPIVYPADTCGVDDPDFCVPATGEPDDCSAASPDVCDPDDVSPDLCPTPVDDVCEAGPPIQMPDTCDGTGADPDVCDPPNGNPDVCPDPAPGDGDVCFEAIEEDTCYATGGEDTCDPPDTVPDICDPSAGNPDDPNPVTVSSVGAEPASSVLPSLGGVAAALGAAALWLRHRLRPEKPEEPETE